jgi:hypothetical protein
VSELAIFTNFLAKIFTKNRDFDLREEQKNKAQESAAAAVAVAVANAASHKSLKRRHDSGKAAMPAAAALPPATPVSAQPPPLMSTRDNSRYLEGGS